MRPRLITAENCASTASGCARCPCFNEAAAHHRGELTRHPRGSRPRGSRFNEAAAHHRGERAADPSVIATWFVASMRPRLITAENGNTVLHLPKERQELQ